MPELVPRFREDHVDAIRSFLRHVLEDSGRKGLVLGLSGGVDSSLVAALCADAVGSKKVIAMILPDGPGGQDLKDARAWARHLRIEARIVDIQPIAACLEKTLGASRAPRVARGNLRARARMIVLYFVANTEDRLVIGTGNKSELLTGYYTLFGDGGCDFLPLGDLYKTQVRAMARHLGVPEVIVSKTPTAGLWKGQTDEGELGLPYEELDRVLLGMELQLDPATIAEKAGVPLDRVRRVEALVSGSVHKRKTPLIPKLGIRTVGLDWRE
jgi:NAD+ synthase